MAFRALALNAARPSHFADSFVAEHLRPETEADRRVALISAAMKTQTQAGLPGFFSGWLSGPRPRQQHPYELDSR